VHILGNSDHAGITILLWHLYPVTKIT